MTQNKKKNKKKTSKVEKIFDEMSVHKQEFRMIT